MKKKRFCNFDHRDGCKNPLQKSGNERRERNENRRVSLFKLSLSAEGITEKVSQFVLQLKSFYIKIFLFADKNVFFDRCRNIKTIKSIYNYTILGFLIFMSTFSEVPSIS
jgi:hypothetical protein